METFNDTALVLKPIFIFLFDAHTQNSFSAIPTLPENYQEKTWEKLKEAVVAIQTSKPIVYCLEELYQAVENMCSHKMDSQLYVSLTGLAENHVKSNIKPFLAERIDKLVS